MINSFVYSRQGYSFGWFCHVKGVSYTDLLVGSWDEAARSGVVNVLTFSAYNLALFCLGFVGTEIANEHNTAARSIAKKATLGAATMPVSLLDSVTQTAAAAAACIDTHESSNWLQQ